MIAYLIITAAILAYVLVNIGLVRMIPVPHDIEEE